MTSFSCNNNSKKTGIVLSQHEFHQVEEGKDAHYQLILKQKGDQPLVQEYELLLNSRIGGQQLSTTYENIGSEIISEWAGKDINGDGYKDIAIHFSTGGNCSFCEGIDLYTLKQGKLQELFVVDGKEEFPRVIDKIVPLGKNNPLLLVSQSYQLSFLPQANQPYIRDLLSWDRKSNRWLPAKDKKERSALIDKESETLLEKIKSERVSEFLYSHILSYILNEWQRSFDKGKIEAIEREFIPYAHNVCMITSQAREECDEKLKELQDLFGEIGIPWDKKLQNLSIARQGVHLEAEHEKYSPSIESSDIRLKHRAKNCHVWRTIYRINYEALNKLILNGYTDSNRTMVYNVRGLDNVNLNILYKLGCEDYPCKNGLTLTEEIKQAIAVLQTYECNSEF